MSTSLIYKLDEEDLIKDVSEGWDAFALRNNGKEACKEHVVGRPIYGCIAGGEVESFYQQVFSKTRSAGNAVSIPFRCDSPSDKRFLNLTVAAEANGDLKCTSKTLAVVPRAEPIELQLVTGQGSASALYMCGLCKGVHLRANLWRELEVVAACEDINTFSKRPFVQTICPSCAERTVACDYLLSMPVHEIGAKRPGMPLVVVLRPLNDYWTFQFTHPEVALQGEYFVLSPFLWETIEDPADYILHRITQTFESHAIDRESVTILAFEQASALAWRVLNDAPEHVAKVVFVNPCGDLPESFDSEEAFQEKDIRIIYESGVAPGLNKPWELQGKENTALKTAKEYHFVSRLSYSLPTLVQVGVV
jgi:hypothetical protein